MRRYGDDVMVGENAVENTALLLKAEPHHVWMHLKSLPSAHVIVQCVEDGAPSAERLMFAGNLCRAHGKFKSFRALKVVYTRVENVVPTDTIGEVTFKSSRKCRTLKLL